MSYISEKFAAQSFYDSYMKWAKAERRRMERERRAAWNALSREEKRRIRNFKHIPISRADFDKQMSIGLDTETIYYIIEE